MLRGLAGYVEEEEGGKCWGVVESCRDANMCGCRLVGRAGKRVRGSGNGDKWVVGEGSLKIKSLRDLVYCRVLVTACTNICGGGGGRRGRNTWASGGEEFERGCKVCKHN
jgi:hypothetical protein